MDVLFVVTFTIAVLALAIGVYHLAANESRSADKCEPGKHYYFQVDFPQSNQEIGFLCAYCGQSKKLVDGVWQTAQPGKDANA